MKNRQIVQPILWIEQPIGAIMRAGSLWPFTCLCAFWNIHWEVMSAKRGLVYHPIFLRFCMNGANGKLKGGGEFVTMLLYSLQLIFLPI
jgi:hypothetical protein